MRVIKTLTPAEREAITKFYMLEQSAEQICSELNMPESEFLKLKSRVKKTIDKEN